jgi:glycosyltransferase involved in cell wall biosynthesis
MVGDTGRVVPPKDPEALANAWQELIDLDPEEREALGNLARSRVIECFALESVVANYEKLYESAIAQR